MIHMSRLHLDKKSVGRSRVVEEVVHGVVHHISEKEGGEEEVMREG